METHVREPRHDMTAFLRAVGESLGEEGRFVHFGLTSSDVIDTALALQFLEAADLLESDLGELLEVLEARAREHQGTLMMGRTHGVHAEPTTFGLKLALWAQEVKGHRQRLAEPRKMGGGGQGSGTVGSYATVPPDVE